MRILEVSEQRVHQLIHEGRLRAVKSDRRWRISVTSLNALLTCRRVRIAVRFLTLEELGGRWRLPMARMRELVRDGWLGVVGDDLVPMSDVRDLEEMGMPGRWRERALRMERMTPPVNQDSCGRGDLAGWEP